MFKKLLVSIAFSLFKLHVLPYLKARAESAIEKATDNILESEHNPVSDDTVEEVEEHIQNAINDLFKEFE